jgi:hypothetical protein
MHAADGPGCDARVAAARPCVRACLGACVRAFVRALVHACVHCVHYVRACIACVHCVRAHGVGAPPGLCLEPAAMMAVAACVELGAGGRSSCCACVHACVRTSVFVGTHALEGYCTAAPARSHTHTYAAAACGGADAPGSKRGGKVVLDITGGARWWAISVALTAAAAWYGMGGCCRRLVKARVIRFLDLCVRPSCLFIRFLWVSAYLQEYAPSHTPSPFVSTCLLAILFSRLLCL